jgi:hypothetical protein
MNKFRVIVVAVFLLSACASGINSDAVEKGYADEPDVIVALEKQISDKETKYITMHNNTFAIYADKEGDGRVNSKLTFFQVEYDSDRMYTILIEKHDNDNDGYFDQLKITELDMPPDEFTQLLADENFESDNIKTESFPIRQKVPEIKMK